MGFYDDLTARENLDYVARLNRLPAAVAQQNIATALEQGRLDRGVTNASDSFRGCASASAWPNSHQGSKLIFLDEPTLGLDPMASTNSSVILSLLSRDRGITVVLSSHLLDQVQRTQPQWHHDEGPHGGHRHDWRTGPTQDRPGRGRRNLRRIYIVISRRPERCGRFFAKNLSDHFTSTRFLITFALILMVAVVTTYTAATNLRQALEGVAKPSHVFLLLFTTSGQLFSLAQFIAFFSPLIGIILGFDAINRERNDNTLSS